MYYSWSILIGDMQLFLGMLQRKIMGFVCLVIVVSIIFIKICNSITIYFELVVCEKVGL